MIQFYVTRDADSSLVEVYPAAVGIRKKEGCVRFISATDDFSSYANAMRLTKDQCWQLFGFVPKEEEAWYVKPNKTGRGVIKERVELEFS